MVSEIKIPGSLIMKKVLLLALAFVLIAACTPRKVVSGDTVTDPTDPQKKEASTEGSEATGIDETIESQDIGQAGMAAEAAVNLPDIYFDYDKYNIRPEYRPALMETSNWLLQNEAVVLIEGHCDDRGTNEYNLALGDRRAKATRDFLMASGVPSRKIEYISYGEERPICVEQKESCWSKNRRSHFVVGLQ